MEKSRILKYISKSKNIKLYKQFPTYREHNNYFITEGKTVLRFKTIDENVIKDSSAIVINTYDNIQ